MLGLKLNHASKRGHWNGGEHSDENKYVTLMIQSIYNSHCINNSSYDRIYQSEYEVSQWQSQWVSDELSHDPIYIFHEQMANKLR